MTRAPFLVIDGKLYRRKGQARGVPKPSAFNRSIGAVGRRALKDRRSLTTIKQRKLATIGAHHDESIHNISCLVSVVGN
jgi:hypothetical protein